MEKPTTGVTPSTANIEAVVKMEEEYLERRTRVERIGDVIAGFAGSMRFVILQLAGFGCWVAINSGKLGIRPFDPYPYSLLTVMVSLEAVLLSAFVLMKQNRMSRRADHRDHLNLQIDLLAEKEITKILQMQRLLSEHLGLRQASLDREALEMSQDTAVEELARDLKEKLPEP